MQTTKVQILEHLKRHGWSRVDSLATALVLAPMTIRQHLTALERDGLVRSRQERQRKGRPHIVFQLTEKGGAAFPKRFDLLAEHLLQEFASIDAGEFAGLPAQERTAFLFERIADRVVELHAKRLAGLPLTERVGVVATILQENSGFVEWTRTSDGYEIRDYNCAYRSLAGGCIPPYGCAWHERVLSRLLGTPAITFLQNGDAGDYCGYRIAGDDPR